MNSVAICSIIFGCCLGSAVVGMVVKLPDHHHDQDSKDTVRLVMGLIATIAALVLSLLIASANSSYNAQKDELRSFSANLILLDRLLSSYGPEAKELRDQLHNSAVIAHDLIWSSGGVQPRNQEYGPRWLNLAQALSPKTDAQRAVHGQIMQLVVSLVQTRLLMLEQVGGTISLPVLMVLVGWISVLFLGFGIFARFNLTVCVALVLGALSVSAAIFLILELGRPYRGVLQISDAPLVNALRQIDK